MTDIMEVANDLATYLSDGSIAFTEDALQAFADHYRKEGAEEANKTVEGLHAQLTADDKQIVAMHKTIEELKQQLAATELVVEQLREALNKYTGQHDRHGSYCTAYEAVQLHPSISALREDRTKTIDRLKSFLACMIECEAYETVVLPHIETFAASELRAKGDK